MKGRVQRFAAAAALAFSGSTATAQTHPDISGIWTRGGAAETPMKPPASGPGPVMNLRPRARGEGIMHWAGNYNSPILQPWAAAKVRAHTEADQSGYPMHSAQETCWPMGVPYILQLNMHAQIAYDNKQVVFLYERHMQRRIAMLNAAHGKDIKPSWFGDSIAHWEGDTLVVDTIGLNDKTWVDHFATPHTEKLHVVERYRLTDPRTLTVTVSVEDPGAFTTPWSGIITYRRDSDPWDEVACSENNIDPNTHELWPIPRATHADF
jgi:hypothetical protein